MKQMIVRAVRTFFQAAAGYVVAHSALAFATVEEDVSFSKGAIAALITAAVASGLAAVMNLPAKEQALQETKKELREDER